MKINPMVLPCILRSIGVFSCIISAVSMTRAQWEPDQRLTFNDSLSSLNINNAWCIANGSSGDVHVVWFDRRDDNLEIYYNHSLDNGLTWSEDTRLSFTHDSSYYPAVACADSVVHVVWTDATDDDIHYRHSYDHGATWGPDTSLGCYPAAYQNVSISAFGPHVSIAGRFVSGIGCFSSSDAGATWPNRCFGMPGYDYPSVAVQDSEVYVVRNNSSRTVLLINRSTDCGATFEPVVDIAGGIDIRTPSIAVHDSIVHVVWRDLRGSWAVIYARSEDCGYSWTLDTTLGQGYCYYPSVAGFNGEVHVVWDKNSSTLHYCHSTDFGRTWSADTVLTNTTGGAFPYPSIDCTDSLVNIVWHDRRDGNWEIYYKRRPASPASVEDTCDIITSRLFAITPSIIDRSFRVVSRRPIHGTVQLCLFDISGRIVWKNAVDINGRDIFVNDQRIAGLPAGVYCLMMRGVGSANTVRVVKIHGGRK